MIDLCIRGALVVDGTGMPSYRADVGVDAGVIVAVGRVDGPARRTLDADGLVVTPGFVDQHTHYDAQLLWDPLATSSCWHGVTTVVTGNCGFTLAPCRPADRGWMLAFFNEVEEVTETALAAGVDWCFESFPEYLDRLDRRLGVNVAAMVGHSAVRRAVMGEAASEREASTDELRELVAVVREAMAAGAVGFSSSDSRVQVDAQGRPVPSKWSSRQERVELARVVGESPGGQIGMVPYSHAIGFREEDMALLEELSVASGRPVNWNGHYYFPGRPDEGPRVQAMMEDARRRGARVYATTRTQPPHRLFTLAHTLPFATLPAWRRLVGLPEAERCARMAREEERAPLRAELEGGRGLRPDSLRVARTGRPESAALVGRRVVDIAADRGVHAADVMLDLALSDGADAEFESVSSPPRGEHEVAAGAILTGPHNLPGNSDAGAHVTSECLAGEVTYFLAHWVRDRGLLPLEEAVRRVTFVPTRLLGLFDRGLVQPGLAADLAVLDYPALGVCPPERVCDLPGGGDRVVQRAEGVRAVVVGGEVLVEDGEHTGAWPGRVLGVGGVRARAA